MTPKESEEEGYIVAAGGLPTLPTPIKKDLDSFDREAKIVIVLLFVVCLVFSILNR